MNIIQAFEDKRLFGSMVKDQSSWANWKVALKAIFSLSMSKKEVDIYREFTGRVKVPKSQFKEVYAVIGRRGGKSFMSAVVACYLALFHDWRKYLSPGERGYIMCIASDRKQAGVVLGYIRAILQLPIFKNKVLNETKEEIELINQITISIVTCSYRALRGYTVLAAVCDEIAFWRVEGANPAKEILTALRPALATIPESILLGISTPYAKSGVLYEAYRDKHSQDDPDTLVWKAPTKAMNPTIPDSIIEKALKEDYSAAKAEWLAEFREDLETFLQTEIIEAAVIPGRWQLPQIEGVNYIAFCDPSGGRVDSFTLAITHKDGEKIILDRLEEKRPPFNPQEVVKEYAGILKGYGLSSVTGDKYAGAWVTQSFDDEGITYEPSKLNKSEIYLEFEPLMARQAVELLDIKRLFEQLRGLERRTRSGGKDLVDHYPGGHDDLANAAAGACVLAAEEKKGKAFIITDTSISDAIRQFSPIHREDDDFIEPGTYEIDEEDF